MKEAARAFREWNLPSVWGKDHLPKEDRMASSVSLRRPQEARQNFAPLICLRCGGLMVAEACEDVLDITGKAGLSAWRCVQCGEFIDPVVLHNRRLQQSGTQAAAGPAL
jgi:hypothetical protein